VIRKLVVAAAAVAVGSTGLVAATAGVSGAKTPTITAGPGSHITCSITATVKLNPSLKNDWVKTDHSGDPVQAVRDILNTTFSVNGPEIISGKGVGTCTGTVTDGVNTAPVTSVKFTLNSDPAHPGAATPATCSALLSNTPSTAQYITTVKYAATGAKVTPTTVTGQTIPPGSFQTTGGTISGSFAGGTASSNGIPDSTTVNALLQGAPTSASPTPVYNQCQPTLVVKTKKGVTTATLKAPKGLKKIPLVAGSSLTLNR
jgi:hypothetical protein